MRRALSTRLPLATFLLPLSAHAQNAQPCTAGRLCNYLTALEAMAAVLAVILVVVLIGAVIYFRRARHTKLEP